MFFLLKRFIYLIIRIHIMYRMPHAFMFTCILSVITLLSVSFLWYVPVLLTFILLVESILMILLYKDKSDIYLFIACGLLGAIAESIAVSLGAWDYNRINIIGIPLWLPLLWGVAGLFVKRLNLKINQLSKH